jgi:hypothetical protein
MLGFKTVSLNWHMTPVDANSNMNTLSAISTKSLQLIPINYYIKSKGFIPCGCLFMAYVFAPLIVTVFESQLFVLADRMALPRHQ